jgi:hypothetical protein
LVLVLAASAPSIAHAEDELETKRACAASYEQTQRLRQDGKLVEAHEQAVLCAQSSCPALLTADCAHWVDELDQALPSVVVTARDAGGKDLPGLRVMVDGRELPRQRSGLALTLNPGPHRFRFQAPGRTPVEREEVVLQGRKNQTIEVVLGEPTTATPAKAQRSAQPWLYVAASTSALGAIGFAYFGLIGRAREHDAQNGCAPRCTDSDLGPMKQAYLAADISLGLAAVGIATSLVLLATSASSERAPAQAEGGALAAHEAHNRERLLRKSPAD